MLAVAVALGACMPAASGDSGVDASADGDARERDGFDWGDAMRESIAVRAVVGLGSPRPGCDGCAFRLESDRGEAIEGRTNRDGTIDTEVPFDRSWSVTVVNTSGGATSLVGIDRPVRGEILLTVAELLSPAATTPAQMVPVRFHGMVPGLNTTAVRFDVVLGAGNNMRSLSVVDGVATDFSVGANANLASLSLTAVVFGTESAGGAFVTRSRYFDAVDARSGLDVDLSQFVAPVLGDPIAIPRAPSGLFGDANETADAAMSSIGRGVLYRRFSEGVLQGSSARVGDCPSEWLGTSMVFRCPSPGGPSTVIERLFAVERSRMHYGWTQLSNEPARTAFPVVTSLGASSFSRRDLQMVSAGDPSMYRAIAMGPTYFADVFGEAEWRVFAFRPGHDGTLKVPTPPAPYTFERVGVNGPCCWRGAQFALIQSRDSTPAWAPEFVHGHLATRIATWANAVPY